MATCDVTVMVSFEPLEKEGCKAKVVSVEHLADLQTEIKQRYSDGEFDVEFANRYIPRFKFQTPADLDAKSIVVVAMPRLPTRAVFNYKGKKHAFILPPTYTAYDEKRLQVENLVAQSVGADGYRIASPDLPLKLLASRSGLTRYGRNNIAYVEGMGSFMRLTAVYSDMPTESDDWGKAEMMPQCQNCNLCQNACPTGAISTDRFLLHAERCLTYHNEKPGDIPFPDWIKQEWHNCVIGCMKCQAACPQNRPYLKQVGEKAEFTEEETGLLLKGASSEEIPVDTMRKMKLLSLTDYLSMMPRNLSVLLNKPT
jgi:epoxyqueuosine reductase